jgi:hypothetical protein
MWPTRKLSPFVPPLNPRGLCSRRNRIGEKADSKHYINAGLPKGDRGTQEKSHHVSIVVNGDNGLYCISYI